MASGPLYRPFLELAREAGVDVDGVLGRMGLTEAHVLDPNTRLSPDQGRELARWLVGPMNDPLLGLRAAGRLQVLDADLLGYLLRHSPDPLAGIDQLARYARLLGDTAEVRVERRAARLAVTIGLSDGRRMLPEASDYAVGVIFRFISELSLGRALPAKVGLPRPSPTELATYRDFFGCPVSFGVERAMLEYDEACLAVPFAHGDPRLVAILKRRADEVMSTLPPRGTVIERVRAYVDRHLEHGEGGLHTIAVKLGMSERTLRRRLCDAGQSYRTILDEVRRERAIALVEQGGHTVIAIAQDVGFADPTAFARAFRRWTGMTPHEYRAR